MNAANVEAFEAVTAPASEPPPPAGHVEVSLVTDTGLPVRLTLPVDHPRLPDLLARRSTRVRSLAHDAVLPAPAAAA